MGSFVELLDEAASHPVEGWNFAWLGARISTTPLPWSFEEIVVRHGRSSPDLLDLGTGGGEWLAALEHRPPRAVASESYAPAVPVAEARLAPLGISVVAVESAPDNNEQAAAENDGRLPFPDESFSLVSSRHESFLAREIARILRPGGAFVTQQVGGDYGDFYDALELARPPAPEQPWDLQLATAQVEAAGLEVTDSGESAERTSFADVGALAWYLRAIPWTVEGFAIEAHRRELEALHERMRESGPLTVGLPAFWLEAVKRG